MGKLQAAMWTGFRQILDTIYNFGHGKFSLLGFIFLLRNIMCAQPDISCLDLCHDTPGSYLQFPRMVVAGGATQSKWLRSMPA